MNNKIIALSLMATFLIGFVAGYNVLYGGGHRDPSFSMNVFVIHEGINGKELIPTGNVITNIAERTIRNLLGFGNATAGTAEIGTNTTKYIALGNATPAATLTKLTTECVNGTTGAFGRALSTVTAWENGTDAAYNVTHTFTQNVTETINACGLHWDGTASGDNNLFACASITQTAFAASDNCTITWVITIDAN